MFGQERIYSRSATMGAAPAKRKVTPAEYMLLVAAAAQTLAGAGKNPSPAQVAMARRLVDRKLAGTSSSGSWSSGSFWSKVKKIAKQAGNAAVRIAPQAGKFAMKAAPIVLPLAAGAIASPFLIKAITSASSSKQAKQEAVEAPPPPPSGDVVVVTPEQPAEGAPTKIEPEGGLADILGVGPYFDVAKKSGELAASIAALQKSTKQHFDKGKQEHADRAALAEAEKMDPEDLAGVYCCGEEEAELACMGGSAEMAALARRGNRRLFSTTGEGVPINNYRAAIWQRAAKLSGGNTPSTKAIFAAEKSVKRDLAKNGLQVVIPGARPARETR